MKTSKTMYVWTDENEIKMSVERYRHGGISIRIRDEHADNITDEEIAEAIDFINESGEHGLDVLDCIKLDGYIRYAIRMGESVDDDELDVEVRVR